MQLSEVTTFQGRCIYVAFFCAISSYPRTQGSPVVAGIHAHLISEAAVFRGIISNRAELQNFQSSLARI